MVEGFNYLKSYCRLLDNTEVPPRFTIWTGIASLLAALQRNVWIEQEAYRIYPNFYFILVAAAGQKKDTAINLPKKLLAGLVRPPNTISQKITPEALIDALQGSKESKDKSAVDRPSGGLVLAGELATFLDRTAYDRGLGPILTALFDCPDVWEHRTIGRGLITLKESYLSILGGSTVELLRNCLPKDAVGGGFSSRTLFVYEDRLAPPVAWIRFDPKRKELEAQLTAYLEAVAQIKGRVELEPAAIDQYERVYNRRYQDRPGIESLGLRAYENRRHLQLLKTALAIMVNQEPRCIITAQDIITAEDLLCEVEEYLPRVMELLVASDTGHSNNLILQYIQAKGKVTRSELVRRFSTQHTSYEISGIIDTLVQSNQVKLETIGSKLTYEFIKGGK